MSSAGQVVGGVVGAVVGFYAGGNVALGASIGMALGGYIDPPKGPKGKPPSASDLAVQTATYGAPMGRGYGTYATMGNVFWVEGNTLRAVEVEAEGGKGGATVPSTYKILGTFAVGFGEGEIDGFGRIWCSGKLVADFTAATVGGAIATAENGGTITLYTGSATQLPDDRIQADMGAANCPAYRGLHYIVFKDWPMADAGNTLMGLQVKAEIIHAGINSPVCEKQSDLYGTSYDGTFLGLTRLESDRLVISSTGYLAWDTDLKSVHKQQFIFGDTKALEISEIDIPEWHDEPFNSKTNIAILQSDSDCMLALLHRNTPTRLIGYTTAGSLFVDTGNVDSTYFPIDDYRASVDRGEIFLAAIGNRIFRVGMTVDPVPYSVYKSAAAWTIKFFGVSENYLFGVLYNSSSPYSCTVYKIDRSTLDLVDTYTQGVGGTSAKIFVVSDREFYTMPTNGVILRWIDGIATDTGLRYTGPVDEYDKFFMSSPSFAWIHAINSTPTNSVYACWLGMTADLVPLADIIEAECVSSGLLDPSNIDTSLITDDVRGYKVSNASAIRASLEPLQTAWPFDVVPSGYVIWFVPRGQSSVATIEASELGAVAGGDVAKVRITASREMDSQLPRKLTVTYMDAGREYDQNTGPGAERLSTDAVNVEQIELPVVMSATEAAQAEEVLLWMRWIDRHDVSFTLPPTYAHLEPADVVTVNDTAASYELRLTGVNYLPDGRIECSAKFNSTAIYTSSAVAQDAYYTGQVLTLSGPSNVALLDIPCVDSSYMNTPGFLAGMAGYLYGWPGGQLVRSEDGGQTWANVQLFQSAAIIGSAVNVIGAGTTHIVDAASRLNVVIPMGSLSSVSELAMFNGANHFAYGSAGRWEIVAAKNVMQEADDSWTLYDLMRGRFGTEQYMDDHAVNDAVVLLDANVLRVVGMNVGSINLPRTWRGVTAGKSIDSASDNLMTYSAVNLKPLPPVYLNGSRNPSTLDWTVTATFRTRMPVEAFSGIPTPGGESSESYALDIYDGAGYSTLKRTIDGLSTMSASYTYAQQVDDFGSERSTLYVDWVKLSATVGRGYPLRQSISRTIVIDPYFDSVVSLIHFDGTGTSITDELGNTWVAQGGATQSATNKLFGTASLALDGVTDYITSTFAADPLNGTGDFTIEWWERPQDQGNRGRFTVRDTAISGSGNTNGVAVGWDGVYWQAYGGGSSHQMGGAGNANPLNTWTHMALERYAGTVNLFKAGNKLGSGYADTTNYSGNIYVAAGAYYSNAYTLLGDMEEFRITKRARYQGTNFTPPTTPFPNS